MTYYPINENQARQANHMMSHSYYKEGSATEEYRRMVDKAAEIAERQKKRVDPMYHGKINRLLDTYARKLADNLNQHYSIMCRCPSILVAGRSNFPVHEKQKQNVADDRNMREFREIQGLLDKIKSTGTGGISSDDPQAVAKLKLKLAELEDAQQTMKAVNAYYRKHKTMDGCDLLTPDVLEEVKAGMARSWRKDPKPFESWGLSNNNANIHRVRERIEELEKRQTAAAPAGWEFDGGKVVVNTEENRLQIIFDDKPDAELRAKLKSEGFRWAPSQGAWQRQWTNNALYAARRIKEIAPMA